MVVVQVWVGCINGCCMVLVGDGVYVVVVRLGMRVQFVVASLINEYRGRI